MIKSQRESQERLNQEFPLLSPKKSFSMVKSNNIIQISQNSQQSILRKSLKSQQALGTLLNNKLNLDYQSPEIGLRKSFRQDKSQLCSFIPNKRAMLQSQCIDVSSQIRSISFKETNLMQVLNQISYIINELKQYKSEKGLISLIEKEIQSNSRFQDLSFLFDQVKLKELVSPEQLFKRIYKQFTYSSDNRTIIRRNKLDQNFLQLLTEFLNKLEDLYRKVHESQFLGLYESMKTSRIKLLNKEIEVQNLFTSQQKKDSYQQFQTFLSSKFTLNKRILESKLFQDINELEEKNGQFKYIDQNNRFISNKIDDILKNIKY
ncbi:unnamed protein product [Paramecium sonneborni]|uniref:Uncharacterized protein n=1 Tax=Paramecium sonneborni TaxID=65129 RepID=A0A8S1K5A0_9CILI|nr:unnamed protein product [Paramecium sonneborni]